MTIPHDRLNRWWIESSAANAALVDAFRPSLCAFMAFGPGREPSFAGTGFVIAGSPEFALVITAKHVLTEGIGRNQRPSQPHAPSALFVSSASSRPALNPEKLKVVWMGPEHANMINVLHATYNDTLDIACCVVAPQETHAAPFRPVSIPIDTTVPQIRDVVHMISLDNMTVDERVPPTDASGIGQTISLTRRVSIRIGVVTGVYPVGLRQYKWPCFTTSIPAEPGMSGGFVMVPRDGHTIGACGIVCADNSHFQSRSDQLQCGESVIASAWPALSLRAPESIPSTTTTATYTLYEFMRIGQIDKAIGGIDHLELLEDHNGDCTIGFR